MTLDLVIRGGTLATASDTFRADVGIRDGRVAAIAEALDGADVIDGTGKLVLPGGIEAHCHIAQESATGGMTADDYRTGSISAAFGGNSCIIPFAAQHRGMGVLETLDLYDGRAEGRSVIDYGYHLIVADPTETALRDELPAAFARGVTSFKVFMTYELMRIDDGQFLDILSVAKAHGALTMVHAENSGIIEWISRRLVEAGHTAPRYHAISHPRRSRGRGHQPRDHAGALRGRAAADRPRLHPRGRGARGEGAAGGRQDLRRDLPAIPVPRPLRPRPAGDGGGEVRLLAPPAGRGHP